MNCKQEFENEVNGKQVLCAKILHDDWDDGACEYFLPRNYSPAMYNTFIESLDFSYYAGYGVQEIYGYIWYVDGTWSERSEYDGSENWDFRECPAIPEELR
jgi:hypothetical protein